VLPVLCSGFFWEGGCADSNYCEVSFCFNYISFVSRGSFCGSDCLLLYCCFAVDYLIKRCHTARYLAAKNGTNTGDLIR
jgi:hypothetical protein